MTRVRPSSRLAAAKTGPDGAFGGSARLFSATCAYSRPSWPATATMPSAPVPSLSATEMTWSTTRWCLPLPISLIPLVSPAHCAPPSGPPGMHRLPPWPASATYRCPRTNARSRGLSRPLATTFTLPTPWWESVPVMVADADADGAVTRETPTTHPAAATIAVTRLRGVARSWMSRDMEPPWAWGTFRPAVCSRPTRVSTHWDGGRSGLPERAHQWSHLAHPPPGTRPARRTNGGARRSARGGHGPRIAADFGDDGESSGRGPAR